MDYETLKTKVEISETTEKEPGREPESHGSASITSENKSDTIEDMRLGQDVIEEEEVFEEVTLEELEKHNRQVKRIKTAIRIILLVGPLIGSIVSSFHVYRFLSLGMHGYEAIAIAIAYEAINLAILAAIVAIPDYQSGWIWTAFILIVIVQIVGNVYSVFDYMKGMLGDDGSWTDNLVILVNELSALPMEADAILVYTSIFMGILIPVVSLITIKATSTFLKINAIPKRLKQEVLDEELEEEVKEKVEQVKDESNKQPLPQNMGISIKLD